MTPLTVFAVALVLGSFLCGELAVGTVVLFLNDVSEVHRAAILSACPL